MRLTLTEGSILVNPAISYRQTSRYGRCVRFPTLCILNESDLIPKSVKSVRLLAKVIAMSLLVTFLMLFESQTILANPGASAWLGHVAADQTLHVNNRHPSANDENSGFERTMPLMTISKAARIAVVSRKQGVSTEILIYPGTYRESIKMGFAERKDDPPIILRARKEAPGETIISGSDIWSNWKKTSHNIYTHPWPYQWGLQPVLATWAERVPINPIIQRREVVFINGERLEQVLAFSDLRPGTFHISEKTKTIYLQPPHGIQLSKARVEVSIRPNLLNVFRIENFVIEGLQFQHGASAIGQNGAVHITSSKNVLIENNRFMLNNWTALGISRVHNMTTRGNGFHRNGGPGWKGIWIKDLHSENDIISYNNWRGRQGKFLRWDTAGVKHLHVHDAIYDGMKAEYNRTRGFWLDADNSDIAIINGCWCNNLTDGLKIEASQGPIKVENSRMCNNQRFGFLVNASRRIMLRNNFIQDNGSTQILITGANERIIPNWESQEKFVTFTGDWTMIGNVVSSPKQLLFAVPDWEHFFNSLYSNSNVWHLSDSGKEFGLGRTGNLTLLSFSEWKEQMSNDTHSTTRLPSHLSVNANPATCR